MAQKKEKPSGAESREPKVERSAKGHKFRKGRGGRFLKVSSLATRVGSSYLGQKIKRVFVSEENSRRSLAAAHLRNAERVSRTFGELKGAVMKVGQMMSAYTDILPDQYTSVLAGLQKSAPAVDFQVIADQIESELGRPWDQVFASLEQEPFASASIGQVHRAVLPDGRQVAVKVQYPGVEQTVDSDVKNLRLVLRSMGMMKKERGVDELVAEVRARLAEEMDYRLELENLDHFRKLFSGDSRVRIPEGVPKCSTRRVLVMEQVSGMDFEELCRSGELELRHHFGQLLVEVFCEQLFEHRAMHADPNPANFSFLKDGTLVLYDFGCVRHFPREFVTGYGVLLADALAGEYDRLPADLDRIGVTPFTGPDYDGDFYKQFAEPLLEPFLCVGDYDFSTARIHDVVIRLALEHWQDGLNFKAPPELVFLDRVIVGMYNNLRQLGARGDFASLLKRPLSKVVDRPRL